MQQNDRTLAGGAGVVGPTLSGLLFARLGSAAPPAVAGAFCLVTALVLLVSTREAPPDGGGRTAKKTQ